MSSAVDCDGMHFDSWSEMRDFLFESHAEEFVWRGVGNAEWCMLTSLDRFAQENYIRDRSALATRLGSLYRRFSSELGDKAANLADEHLWAIGQHWGLPTTLLDWTRSPMVAVYFAVTALSPGADLDDRNCVVYRLDSTRPFLNRGGDVSVLSPPPGPWNKRLAAQQGAFVSSRMGTCFIQQLRELGESDSLRAYTMSPMVRTAALRDLQAMMISDRKLFPDRDGILREVRTQAVHGLDHNV